MPCDKGFLCFNCKPRWPELGKNKWEICITVINVLLLIVSFAEIVAFANYAQVFSEGTADACCGLIEEKTFPLAGAVCDEHDIVNGEIGSQTFDNSRLCVINDIICEEYNYVDQGNSSTLEDCLNAGGFALSDICATELLDAETSYDTTEVAMVCIIICIAISMITFVFLCEWVGCFEHSCWCRNRMVQFINKMLEIVIWCSLLYVSTVTVENTATNGYRNVSPDRDDSEAEEWVEDMCEIERHDIIWVSFKLDLPDWLASTAWNVIAILGVALSVIEFLLFFKLFFASRSICPQKGTSTEEEDGETKADTAATDERKMEKQIEMGGHGTETRTDNVPLETGNEDEDEHEDDEKEAEYVTPGGDNIDEDEHEDDEKETEYVTPGGGTEAVTLQSGGTDGQESDEDVLLNDDDEKEAEYLTPQ